jgi:pre-mRNA-splicing factor CDC5/CEF1
MANTSKGKKAKRKARERQLEESRRVAALQKRRELKMSGINIKIKTAKKGEMDYNADIPFERQPAPGFYDTREEQDVNEKERSSFDPRKQQLAIKRKGEPQDEDDDRKRRKNDKGGQPPGFAAAMKAAQLQKLREKEQMSKRRSLALPAPQVTDSEMEEIVKMGIAGERAVGEGGRGFVGEYSGLPQATPIRTPMAPQEEDRVANEIANIRALTETKSALLGGENADLVEGAGSTGFQGIAPSKQAVATPNPMATPLRQNGTVSQTPLRTPRDSLQLNQGTSIVGSTPREVRVQQKSLRTDLLSKLAALPKPKETEWELELPEEQDEEAASSANASKEDASVRDQRERLAREAREREEFQSQSQVIQRRLPRPRIIDWNALLAVANAEEDPIRREIAIEAAKGIANDVLKFGGKVTGKPAPLAVVAPNDASKARATVLQSISPNIRDSFVSGFNEAHARSTLPGLDGYDSDDELDEAQILISTFDGIQSKIISSAEQGNELEKKLSKLHGGYIARSKTLKDKLSAAHDALEAAQKELTISLNAQVNEDAAAQHRLERLREEVAFVSRREREEQDDYRLVKDELSDLTLNGKVNGVH